MVKLTINVDIKNNIQIFVVFTFTLLWLVKLDNFTCPLQTIRHMTLHLLSTHVDPKRMRKKSKTEKNTKFFCRNSVQVKTSFTQVMTCTIPWEFPRHNITPGSLFKIT